MCSAVCMFAGNDVGGERCQSTGNYQGNITRQKIDFLAHKVYFYLKFIRGFTPESMRHC